jgi:hypothetical protein
MTLEFNKFVVLPLLEVRVDEDGNEDAELTAWVDCTCGLCDFNKWMKGSSEMVVRLEPGNPLMDLDAVRGAAAAALVLFLPHCHLSCELFRDWYAGVDQEETVVLHMRIPTFEAI